MIAPLSTERFDALITYGLSEATLYRHGDL
jgi:hypothetical protein